MGRINHTPNFFHFKNQQSSLDNHQSDGKNAGSVPAYAPNIRARGRPGPSPLQLFGAFGPLGVACKMAVRAVSCAVNASCIPRSNELR